MVKVFSGILVIHHRRRGTLNLAAEVKVPKLAHGIVDLIGEGTCPMPDLQVLKILRKIHVAAFYFLPSTFHQRFSGIEHRAFLKLTTAT
jgi:hypothetical protein